MNDLNCRVQSNPVARAMTQARIAVCKMAQFPEYMNGTMDTYSSQIVNVHNVTEIKRWIDVLNKLDTNQSELCLQMGFDPLEAHILILCII